MPPKLDLKRMKKTSTEFGEIELEAHDATSDGCNGSTTEEQFEMTDIDVENGYEKDGALKRRHRDIASKKAKICALVIGCVVVAGTLAAMALAGVFDSATSRQPTILAPTFRGPLPTNDGGIKIPLSAKSASTVLFVTETSADGEQVERLRSYDGNHWEVIGTKPVLVPEACDSSGCVVQLPKNRVFSILESTERIAQTLDEGISRLLLQASFGPTRSDIAQFKLDFPQEGTSERNVALWLSQQIDMEPTLLRSYYRKRANPRLYGKGSALGAAWPMCAVGSRWHRFALTRRDVFHTIIVTTGETEGKFSIRRDDGLLLTETTTFLEWDLSNATSWRNNPPPASANHVVCSVRERLGGDVRLSLANTSSCEHNYNRPSTDEIILWRNPPIFFSRPSPTDILKQLSPPDVELAPIANVPGVVLLKSTSGTSKCQSDWGQGGEAYLGHVDSIDETLSGFYRHDSRLRLLENTDSNPASVEAKNSLSCPTVGRSFLNAHGCEIKPTCAPLEFQSTEFKLDEATLRYWYQASHKHVLVMRGLRLEGPDEISPCPPSSKSAVTSRWQRLGLCSELPSEMSVTMLDEGTANAIADAIRHAEELGDVENPLLLDATVLNFEDCTDPLALGAIVAVSPASNSSDPTATAASPRFCFQHIHRNEFDVVDASYWTIAHDGNKEAIDAQRPNPISRIAQQGRTELWFPAWHDAGRWKSRKEYLPRVGRMQDVVDFRSLPSELQTVEMADRVGALTDNVAQQGLEACGSPGEIGNSPSEGYHYVMHSARDKKEDLRELDFPHAENEGAPTVWANVALKAKDQLRQRAAWALAQIFTLGVEDSDSGSEDVEEYLVYYDIFVRHAFGNLKDVLKEVTYSPAMSIYLSFRQNKAKFFGGTFPDENYGREIMQLFSLGLWQLHTNGTEVGSQAGTRSETYGNEHVFALSRIWTGFDNRPSRANVEADSGISTKNRYDPNQIKPEWRDPLPKIDLADGYIGDGYPLCNSLPPQHFLMPGARWLYQGDLPVEGAEVDYGSNETVLPPYPTVTPQGIPGSLHEALCRPSTADGACTWPTEVILPSEGAKCEGKLCGSGEMQGIKVVDLVGGVSRFYSYRRPPCVNLAFYDEGKLTSRPTKKGLQCSDPSLEMHGIACCKSGSPTRVETGYRGFWSQDRKDESFPCRFVGEKNKFQTAQQRCHELGFDLCHIPEGDVGVKVSETCSTCTCDSYFWLNNTCSLQVQVHSDGAISIIDQSFFENSRAARDFGSQFLPNSIGGRFAVHWTNNNFPQPDAQSLKCPPGCVEEASASCLCSVTVIQEPVYDAAAFPASVQEAVRELRIGTLDPSVLSASTDAVYTQVKGPSGVIKAHLLEGGQPSDTIFELPPRRPGGLQRFVRNLRSFVKVSGGMFGFRNPPAFMPNVGQTLTTSTHNSIKQRTAEAENEVDALLDYLVEHDNTAPFICKLIIQRLVTSNPSARYIQAVVTAFSTGEVKGISFSGRYGDLGATFAAVLLDREARTPVLDVDPTHGVLREPILKLLHVLRSLEYHSWHGREVSQQDWQDKLGMAAFKPPSVFGFYLPSYQPSGRLSSRDMASPESQLATAPQIVTYLNAFSSLVNYGLTSCENGFGDGATQYNYPDEDMYLDDGHTRSGRWCTRKNYSLTADGSLDYLPTPDMDSDPEAAANELSVLLTAGRMRANQAAFQSVVEAMRDDAPPDERSTKAKRMKKALKIAALSAEFHSSTQNTPLNMSREAQQTSSSPTAESNQGYKAVVVVFMRGGADTFNSIVPHSDCQASEAPLKDYYQHYQEVRGLNAIAKPDLLPFGTTKSSLQQPCDTFGHNPNLKFIHERYLAGEAAWVANVGGLVEPLTLEEYKSKSKQRPPSLFSHNIMQRSLANLHAQYAPAKGVLGRMMNSLSKQDKPYKGDLFSIQGNQKMLEGDQPPVVVDDKKGIPRFAELEQLSAAVGNMTALQGSHHFGETWNSVLYTTLQQTEKLGAALDQVELNHFMPEETSIGRQMDKVAKLVKLRSFTQNKRDVFLVQQTGFDTHNTFENFGLNLAALDSTLRPFRDEMIAQGVWQNVTIVTVSDFGRTLTSNGLGTDHAWGGNHFVLGGDVAGGKIHGKFPSRFTSGENDIGRGRVLPTTAWEAMWYGISKWFGVSEKDMLDVLPNINNFQPSENHLFSEAQMFKTTA